MREIRILYENNVLTFSCCYSELVMISWSWALENVLSFAMVLKRKCFLLPLSYPLSFSVTQSHIHAYSRFLIDSLMHAFTYSLIHSLPHNLALTYSLSHLLTHSFTPSHSSLTYSLSHPLTHILTHWFSYSPEVLLVLKSNWPKELKLVRRRSYPSTDQS